METISIKAEKGPQEDGGGISFSKIDIDVPDVKMGGLENFETIIQTAGKIIFFM